MNAPRFDALSLSQMASGHICLNLSETVSWDAFPEFADRVLKAVDGLVRQKNDATDIRLWSVEIRGSTLRFVFDDYPSTVSLESSDVQGDLILKELYQELSNASA